MDIRPAEISDILKKQIASFDTEADISETGQGAQRWVTALPACSACRTSWPAKWWNSPAPACAAWR